MRAEGPPNFHLSGFTGRAAQYFPLSLVHLSHSSYLVLFVDLVHFSRLILSLRSGSLVEYGTITMLGSLQSDVTVPEDGSLGLPWYYRIYWFNRRY